MLKWAERGAFLSTADRYEPDGVVRESIMKYVSYDIPLFWTSISLALVDGTACL